MSQFLLLKIMSAN